MSIDNPVLTEYRDHCPFLAQGVFDWSDGTLDAKILRSYLQDYIGNHLWKNKNKKEASSQEVLEGLIHAVTRCAGGLVFGTDSNPFAARAKTLSQGEVIELHMEFVNVRLELKRFGTCIGIRPLDSNGKPHLDATEVLEEMCQASRTLLPFVHSRCVDMPRWQAYKDQCIDIEKELVTAARYIPDVQWGKDSSQVAFDLMKKYISTDPRFERGGYGVEVGQYHGIPIYALILFGGEDKDATWRKGSISLQDTVLTFGANSSESPILRYTIRTAFDGNTFVKAPLDIDYADEQFCQGKLAKLLLDGFSARDLGETIVRNPHWVKWKKGPLATVG